MNMFKIPILKTIHELDIFWNIMTEIRETIKTKLLGFNYPIMKSTVFNVPAIGYLEALYNIDLLERKLGFTVDESIFPECQKWELTAFYEYVKIKACITECKNKLQALSRDSKFGNSYPIYSDLLANVNFEKDVIYPTMIERL